MGETDCNIRKAYAGTLSELAKNNKGIVVLDADSREPTKIDIFAKDFPERSFCFGIAEQNMITVAAAMATEGLIPFVNTYATFAAFRALDQIRNSVAYPNLNVKIVVSHFGLDVGPDGVTHQAIEDLAIMRSIPNMMVISPVDDIEVRQVVKFICQYDGPVYLRTGKSDVPRVLSEDYRFKPGKPAVLLQGGDVTIFTFGIMISRSIEATKLLKDKGIETTLVNVSSLKPIDSTAIIELASKTGVVVTVEDHNIYGGLGGLISETLAKDYPLPVEIVGVPDQFQEAGNPDQLYSKCEMDPEGIMRAVLKALERKR